MAGTEFVLGGGFLRGIMCSPSRYRLPYIEVCKMGTGTCPGKEEGAVCMKHSLALVLAGLKRDIKSGRAAIEEVP